jgi:hypothetical protein
MSAFSGFGEIASVKGDTTGAGTNRSVPGGTLTCCHAFRQTRSCEIISWVIHDLVALAGDRQSIVSRSKGAARPDERLHTVLRSPGQSKPEQIVARQLLELPASANSPFITARLKR